MPADTAIKSDAPSRPPWLSTFLFPFASRFVDVEGCRVHYVDEGRGPTLLMLHGNPTWSFLYRNVIRGLSDRFRCVALDYPGFGLSRAPAGYDFRPASHAAVVARFVRALDLTRVTLMVQDWGGPIGLGVAGREPERFRALVIGNTWAWPVNGDRHFERFAKTFGGTVGRFAIRHFNAFVNLLLPAGTTRRLRKEVMAAYRAPFPTPASREPTAVFPREILASREYLAEVARRLPAISHLPTLLVWGGKDIAFRAPELRRFESTFTSCKTVHLPRAGHFIQEDAPEAIVEAVRRFWAERMEVS